MIEVNVSAFYVLVQTGRRISVVLAEHPANVCFAFMGYFIGGSIQISHEMHRDTLRNMKNAVNEKKHMLKYIKKIKNKVN